MDIIDVPTDVIKPYFRNPRVNEKTVQALVTIIPRVGFNVPLLVDKDYVIIKGHARWKAGCRLGMETMPCVISQNDDELNKIDRLADNKISELSQWVHDELEQELISLDMTGLEDIGFDVSNYDDSITWAEEPIFDDGFVESGSAVPSHMATPRDIDSAMDAIKNVKLTKNDDIKNYVPLKCPDCGHEFSLSRNELINLLKGV